MIRKSKNTVSIRRDFVIMLCVCLFLIGLLLPSCIILPRSIIRTRVEEANSKLLDVYSGLLDKSWKFTQEAVFMLAVNDTLVGQLNLKISGILRFNIMTQLRDRMINELNISNNAYGFMFYSKENQIYLDRFIDKASYRERMSMQSFVKERYEQSLADNATADGNWFAAEVEGKIFLVCLFREGACIVGACIDPEDVLSELYPYEYGKDGTILLVDGSGNALTHRDLLEETQIHLDTLLATGKAENGTHYSVLRKATAVTDFELVMLYPINSILGGFNTLLVVLIVVCAVIIIFASLMMVTMHKTLMVPLRSLLDGMHEIASGNITYQIDTDIHYQEFQDVACAFNDMASKLNLISREYYAKILDEQKITLQYRQLQIRPHFLYNSLNTICLLMRVKRIDAAGELCECLIAYFRYLLTDINLLVPIGREVEHLRNSVHIQELRNPDRISMVFDVEDAALECQIPPLIIHTLLENTLKHASSSDGQLFVRLKIRLLHEGDRPMLSILLSDSGNGFSQEALHYLGQGGMPTEDGNEHIGLRNTCHRLTLLFGDHASVRFYNAEDSGACNELILPALMRGETTYEAPVDR
ncbi:MAG: histidine kinase [Clostridiales bacterium]|nr:histidine kinase [Clostridiales bacterium]